ncbi:MULTISPECIES: hypothetical protein [unclassified Paraburkholderia]|uniref:hypothetical protein n=1 Tax=unclassified Paraburkholderia TaxID=2615204 RepID=UPI002AB0A9AA|nr:MULTISPECIES: hypothetical protein [unclassified Paraburkholderia]
MKLFEVATPPDYCEIRNWNSPTSAYIRLGHLPKIQSTLDLRNAMQHAGRFKQFWRSPS